MNSLKLCNVDLGYRENPVVSNVTLEINCGEIVGIIGPNGSGKSTALKALCGLLQPSAGVVMIDGDDMRKTRREVLARQIGMVFQAPTLPESFTVLEMVMLGRYPHLGMLRHESKKDLDIVFNAMERTGIVPLSDRRVGEISGGEKQRVLIARSLAQEPRFLLLDEPTAHLDIQHQLEIMDLIRSLADSGIGVGIALHDFSLASRYCHRLVMLKDGGVFKEGRPGEVITTDNIEQAFGVTAMIYNDLFATPLVINAGLSRPASGDVRKHIHIIGGGGSASAVMQRLYLHGYRLTTGVLNQGDTDLSTARALGIEALAVPPFSVIDDNSHQLNVALAVHADCCLISNSAFGWANLRNLEAAAAAETLVLIEDTPVEERDFTGGEASQVYEILKERAICTTSEEIIDCIAGILLQEEVENALRKG